jgi:predicted anti-sigma-YlaC factor YlaD
MKQRLTIFRILTVHCDEIVPLVSQSLDADLSRTERIAVRIHLLYCTACKRFRKHMAFLHDALRDCYEKDEHPESYIAHSLSPAARDRIQRSLDSAS